METVNQLILAKSVNIFRLKSSSEQTKQSTDSEIFKKGQVDVFLFGYWKNQKSFRN